MIYESLIHVRGSLEAAQLALPGDAFMKEKPPPEEPIGGKSVSAEMRGRVPTLVFARTLSRSGVRESIAGFPRARAVGA